RCGAIGLYTGDCDLEYRKPALVLLDLHRKLHAAEILVVGINSFDKRIAGEAAIDSGLDMFNEILLIDRARNRVFAERRKRNDLVTARTRYFGRGRICCCALQEPMRREPDVERPDFRPPVRVLILDDIARDRPDAALP